jgi:hypothetical protein
MKELWSSSVFWRVLINSIGVVSVILGFWLLFKLIKFIYSLRKNKNLNAKNYIDLLPIPSEFKGNVQIGIILNNKQNIDFNILDNKEKQLENIYNGDIEKGEKIFKIDSLKFQNGEYFISIKTDHQKILRKILVDN